MLQAGRVLARRARDPQGAPVGLAAPEGRLLRSASSRPRRSSRGSRTSSRTVSAAWRGGQAERGFSMAIDDLARPGHRARARAGRGRLRSAASSISRLSPARRRLVAEHDAPAAGSSERADGVPHRRDARLGAARRARASSRSTSARSPTSSRPSARRRRCAGSSAACSCSPTTSSSSSGSTSSTGSSSRNGGGATSASSASPTCRRSGSPTSMPSRCSCRRGRGRAGARVAAVPPPDRGAARVAFLEVSTHAQHRAPVRDRAGHGAPRLRLLLRGAPAQRPPAGPLGGEPARRPRLPTQGVGSCARPAPAGGARRARADVREVRAAPLDAPGRRPARHRRRAARAAGRRDGRSRSSRSSG